MSNAKLSIFLAALAFSLSHFASADVVYLKNGATLEGKVAYLGEI